MVKSLTIVVDIKERVASSQMKFLGPLDATGLLRLGNP